MTNTIVPAVCTRRPSNPFNTKYGQRVKAEFRLESGEVVPVFADATDVDFTSLRVNQHVDLLHGSKGYTVGRVGEVSYLPPQASHRPATLPVVPAASEGELYAAKAIKQLGALAYCYRLVSKDETFKLLSEDGQRQMAVTLFIQMSK